MSKVKIPLKWYSDLIHIPGTDNEYVLLEWFEEEECKNKTLFCLGYYIKVTQYQIHEHINYSNTELTRKVLNNKANLIKIGEYVTKNIMYNPLLYKKMKGEHWFEEANA